MLVVVQRDPKRRAAHFRAIAEEDASARRAALGTSTPGQRLEEAIALSACLLADGLRRGDAEPAERPLPPGLRARLR